MTSCWLCSPPSRLEGRHRTKAAAFVREWLSLGLAERVLAVGRFRDTILKKDGEPRAMGGAAKLDPRFTDYQDNIAEALREYETRRSLLACAKIVTSALEIGRAFAVRWEARKAREGLLDFGDLIRKAAALLGDSEAATGSATSSTGTSTTS